MQINTPTNTALRIVSAPRHTDTHSMRLLAWAMLKSQRGQPIIQTRSQGNA